MIELCDGFLVCLEREELDLALAALEEVIGANGWFKTAELKSLIAKLEKAADE